MMMMMMLMMMMMMMMIAVVMWHIADGADNLFAIVVYVPSARGNFNQRKSIRETWLGHVNQNDTLRNRFAELCQLLFLRVSKSVLEL